LIKKYYIIFFIQTRNKKQETRNKKQETTKYKIMNKETLFYLLPKDVYINILKHLDRDTRTIMWCLIYYGDKLDLWYKWYPLTLK